MKFTIPTCSKMALKSIRIMSSLVFLTLVLSNAMAASDLGTTTISDKRLICLAKAYPDHLISPTDHKSLQSRHGQSYPFNPQQTYKNYEDELDYADLYSQLRVPYPTGLLQTAPDHHADPGRLRHQPLFLDMYGDSASAVASNLVQVYWAPCRCEIQFSKINGAASALQAVGDEIEKAGLGRYVAQPLGTFNWRKIAGTQRLSMHAFGIAIDFKLPRSLGRYWRWELGRLNHANRQNWYPQEILQDEALNHVVNIFESKGFVWGGKWWHYDSIHFEYRPELSLFGCSQK